MTAEGAIGRRGVPTPVPMTLRRFYRDHFVPTIAITNELSERTLLDYSLCVDYWDQLFPRLPLSRITPLHVQRFRDHIKQLPGRSGNATCSPWTTRRHLTNLRRLLLSASRPSYHGRYGMHGLSLIDAAPIVPTPRIPRRAPKPTYTADEVRRMLVVARSMLIPQVDGVPRGQWWVAIILTACYTGFRRGTLLRLEKPWVSEDRITVPAEGLKGGRGDLSVALAPEVKAAIRPLVSVPGRLLFGFWRTDAGNLNRHLRAIYDAAGMPPERWHAWHGFRRYVASELTRSVGIAAASTMLGHSSLAVTRDHYASLESQLEATLRDQQQALGSLPKLI